jgi:hypothetical protein
VLFNNGTFGQGIVLYFYFIRFVLWGRGKKRLESKKGLAKAAWMPKTKCHHFILLFRTYKTRRRAPSHPLLHNSYLPPFQSVNVYYYTSPPTSPSTPTDFQQTVMSSDDILVRTFSFPSITPIANAQKSFPIHSFIHSFSLNLDPPNAPNGTMNSPATSLPSTTVCMAVVTVS